MRLERRVLITVVAICALGACTRGNEPMNQRSPSVDFATRYAAAWSGHSAASVASFYSESGSLAINDGKPSVGRRAIANSAQSFITAYPDLIVRCDGLEPKGERTLFHWTFVGTNTGPGGTGGHVQISGWEDWRIGPDGLIADSKGHYDARDWDRQVQRR